MLRLVKRGLWRAVVLLIPRLHGPRLRLRSFSAVTLPELQRRLTKLLYRIGGVGSLPLTEEWRGRAIRRVNAELKREGILTSLDPDADTALDLGCNSGYYSFMLSKRGLMTLGIDIDREALATAKTIANTKEFWELPVGFMYTKLDRKTVNHLPEADVVLFLSAFHTFCLHYGFDEAYEILRVIWTKVRGSLYFETAETDQRPALYGGYLPDMGNSSAESQEYITKMLSGIDDRASITCLGYFPLTAQKSESRHLFLMRRPSEN